MDTAAADADTDGDLRELRVADGSVIAYRVFEGETPAVVILHGLAGSGTEFIPTARALAGRKVVVVDQRGHGRSTRRPADTSRAAFVADVVQVIEHEGSAPVDLVGQSMGAHTAMLVSAARPDLVHRLVILEGNEGGGTAADVTALGDFFRSWQVPFADEATARAALGEGPLAAAWIADLEHRPDGLHPRFDAEVMVSTLTAVTEPRWADWERVSAPTLVIYADGGMFSAEQKRAFVRRGRNVTRVDLADASHDAHLDAFDQWIDVLHDFLL